MYSKCSCCVSNLITLDNKVTNSGSKRALFYQSKIKGSLLSSFNPRSRLLIWYVLCLDNELFIWKSGCFERSFFHLCLGVSLSTHSMVYLHNSCCCVPIDHYCSSACKRNVFLSRKSNEVGWHHEMCCTHFFHTLTFANSIFYILSSIYLYYNTYGK